MCAKILKTISNALPKSHPIFSTALLREREMGLAIGAELGRSRLTIVEVAEVAELPTY